MTSKPDSVSTLGYHWTDHTGRPLEPQVHWDVIGTPLADASTQWCSSGNPVLIFIIGTHGKTTGKPLEDHWEAHWLPTIISPVAFQCTLASKFQAHLIATGLPLEHHWLRVRAVKQSWRLWVNEFNESVENPLFNHNNRNKHDYEFQVCITCVPLIKCSINH